MYASQKPKTGKADLHIHTDVSIDGNSSPKEVVEYASLYTDLDVIAITDHNKIRGAKEAERIARNYSIDVIVGEEIGTEEGEVIGLFIDREIKAGMSLLRTVKEIKKQGGLIVIPHPFSWFLGVKPVLSLEKMYNLYSEEGEDVIDAFEVLNSCPKLSPKTKSKLVEKNKRICEKIFGLPGLGGSDAHKKEHIGLGYTLFEGHGAEDIRKAIESGKVSVGGEMISRAEHARTMGKSIVSISKKIVRGTKNKIKTPYHKIRGKITNSNIFITNKK